MEPVMEKAGKKLGSAPKKDGKKSMRMEMEQLDDKSFLVTHHIDGAEKPQRFSHKDLKSVHDHIDKHWQDEKGTSDKTPKLPTSPEKPEIDAQAPPKKAE